MKKIITIAVVFLFSLSTHTNAEVTINGQKGLLRTYSAKTLKKGKLAINLSSEYSGDTYYVKDITNPQVISVSSNLGLTFGLANFLDLSFAIPVYMDMLNGDNIDKIQDGAPGDAGISLKFQYPPYEHPGVFDMSYFGHLYLPTGTKNKGVFPRHVYHRASSTQNDISLYTAEKPAVDMLMLWTLDFGQIAWESQDQTQIQVHLNFGARFNTNTNLEHAFLLNTALEYSPVPFITAFCELTGETRLSKFSSGWHVGNDPLRVTPGISINTPAGLVLKISGDKSLCVDTTYTWNQKNRTYKTGIIPDWNVTGAIQWSGFLISQDKDHDRIKDDVDKCPEVPEDYDGFEDFDGCPDMDNDKDGVPDKKDKCPNSPEDLDGFEDADGCPEADNDKDGIPDKKDRCPILPEDFDGFEDTDGCPDIDNDKDGILDSVDKCINDPEDKDNFEDSDGCPELDNDKDGIPDKKDKCPNKPENINQFKDTDGCPDVKKVVKKIQQRMILKGVNFKTGSAELTYEALGILDKIIVQLKAYPKVRLEIRGYTDNLGRRTANIRLSQKRAESVRNYFARNNVNIGRLVAIGFGPDNPIASNRTARGRAQNRRIELYRLN